MSDSPCHTTSAAHPSSMETIAHPTGVAVDIFGIEAGNHGRSCEELDVCVRVLEENAVVRIRHVQILVDCNENRLLDCRWD